MSYRKGFITNDSEWGTQFTVHYVSRPNGRKYTKSFRTRIEARHFLDRKPKPTAYEMIQYHMRENELGVLSHIRKLNKKFEGYRPIFAGGAWGKAIDRLEKKGKVFYRKSNRLSSYGMTGYWVRTSKRTK